MLLSAVNMSNITEPILENEEVYRLTMEPVLYEDIWNFYKRGLEMFWTFDEIKEELAKDTKGWKDLDARVQHFIKHIVAFFAISDSLVNETIGDEILNRVQIREAKTWYNFQMMMEDIHSKVYSDLVIEYCETPEERRMVFEAVKNYPTIKRKQDWIYKWVGRENVFRHLPSDTKDMLQKTMRLAQINVENVLSFINFETELDEPSAPIPKLEKLLYQILEDPGVSLAQVILANCIVEGVFFSGSFCAIFWINHYYKGLLPGLAKANEWISRDEGTHTDFAILLYRKYVKNRLPQDVVHNMFTEAVDIESDFVHAALPTGLKGMNSKLMIDYIKFVADDLLKDLGYDKIWNKANPFNFMLKQSLSVRIPDFFVDQTPSEYGGVINNGLGFDEDF